MVATLRGEELTDGVEIVGALARPGRSDIARQKLPDVEIFETLDDLLSEGLDIVAEVAGQQAVWQYGEQVLRGHTDLLVISVGALADAKLFERLETAAEDGDARILLPAGAIGGLDAIAAMRLGRLELRALSVAQAAGSLARVARGAGG